MINAIIIDDEPLARSLVKEYLSGYGGVTVVQECSDGFEGVKAIMQAQPQLVFLDIQMPKINGFEMLELVEPRPSVIFTTAFDEYAIKAFEAHAVDYLLKPFSKERFDRAMERFFSQTPAQHKQIDELIEAPIVPVQAGRVVVKTGGKIRIIPVPEIRYMEAADDYVKIYTADGSYLKTKTMAYFEKFLPADQFVRIHRSYLVNIAEVTRIDPYEKDNHLVLLRSGARLPVSRSGYARLKAVLGI